MVEEFGSWGECEWTARDLRSRALLESDARNLYELAYLDARVRAARMRLVAFALLTLCAIVAVLLAVR